MYHPHCDRKHNQSRVDDTVLTSMMTRVRNLPSTFIKTWEKSPGHRAGCFRPVEDRRRLVLWWCAAGHGECGDKILGACADLATCLGQSPVKYPSCSCFSLGSQLEGAWLVKCNLGGPLRVSPDPALMAIRGLRPAQTGRSMHLLAQHAL